MRICDNEEILGKLALACYRSGGIRKWAEKNNCSYSSVSRILSGKREMTDGIAKILKIEIHEVWMLTDES